MQDRGGGLPGSLLGQVLDPAIRGYLPDGTILHILFLIDPLDYAVEQVVVLVNGG